MIKVNKRADCRLCHSTDVELVVPLAPTPVAEKYLSEAQLGQREEFYPLDLYMCRSCGHVQLLDVVDPAYLFGNDYTYRTGQTQGIVDHFDEYARSVCAKYQPVDDSLVIEIGSNDGTLLKSFQRRGLRVLGIDPAGEIAKQATVDGIETLAKFASVELAESIRADYGAASVVTANNVFAHADDLGAMAESIHRSLAPDGVFVFEVSYLLDVIDKLLLGTIFHEHLCYHSVKSMRAFLCRHGMELIDIERVGIQGGSIIGTAQLDGGPRPVSGSVAELVDLESSRGLDQPDTLKEFGARLQKLKDSVHDLVSRAQAAGQTIAGYGAARSGTTLISQMGLGDVIEYMVDDHPDKTGKFSPGHHIPVLPTSAIYERKPDFLFVLAWIHATKIIAGNQSYLEQGGKFIVSVPDVEIISAES